MTTTQTLGSIVVVLLFALVMTLLLGGRGRKPLRAPEPDETVSVGMRPRLTENRRAKIYEHLAIIVESWASLTPETTKADATGDAAMLAQQCQWLAEKLDEMLRFHVSIEAGLTPEDDKPGKPLRDRLRGLLAFGRDKAASGQ